VSLAAAQQQDETNKAAPNPLVQLLQTKGVLTAQEAAAINQAATPAEQQSRLTQLLYSKGIITQDEYKQTAAAETRRASDFQGTLVPAAAHVSAGEPEPAMAMPPQAPAAPAVIPAVAPVRLLTSDPPKAGGLVPDITLGTKAKLKFYGFVKATATYDSSSPYNVGFELPGLGSAANGSLPTDVPTGLTSTSLGVPGAGTADSGPNGSPGFYLKASATRMGANFEWPDIAGTSNTLTGRIETDFEGNFSRAQNRNISSLRTRMMVLRLAWARIDHKFSDTTTGFALFGMDWTPFASSTFPSLLESEGGGIYFGNIYEREAQIRFGLWHDFGGSRNFKIGIEPALGMPGFANLPADLGVQLGVSERQGIDSARPEVSGRVVFQWQLDKAKGVAPAQIIFSGMNAKRVEIVNRAAIANMFCTAGVTVNTTTGVGNLANCPTQGITTPGTPAAVPAPGPGQPSFTTLPVYGGAGQTPAQINQLYAGAPAAGFVFGTGTVASPAAGTILSAFNQGTANSSQRWGATAEVQLPTRYFTLIGKYYTGADLRYYFGGQIFGMYNDNRVGLLSFNPAISGGGATCGINGTGCAQAFSIDTSNPNVFFGWDATAGQWRLVPQSPMRSVGGFAQISFPLSRLFNANPAGRNAGWTLAFLYGTDQAKARDVRAMQASTFVASNPLLFANSNGQRNRSDMGVATLMWRFNQYVNFGYESSVYLTRSTCAGAGVVTAGGIPGCAGTLFRGVAARYWHDWRNEFGPTFTF
jgi:hypothetical protein